MAFFWQANDEFPLGIGNGAINVECVDGGTVEDVLFDDIKAEGFRVPIFVRGSLRRRRSNGVPPSSRLVLRGVRIRNVRGTACSEFPSTITGASGCEPKGVLLENVHILCRGDASDGRPVCEPSALYDGFYPDASMFKFLKLPAYGLYIDRADVKCENVRFSLPENAEDRRPTIYTSTPESQAARARLSGFRKSLELTDALAEEGLDEALSSQKWEVVYISVCQHADEVAKAFMARVFTLTEKIRQLAPQAAVFLRKRGTDEVYKNLEASPYGFRTVADNHRPETWFHLIGGNVSKEGLTADLEAIKAAGFGGIQFFHGETKAIWPGVEEPIRCMSDKWEDVVAHLVPDVVFDSLENAGPDDFMWYHRQTPEEDIYFLATSSNNGYHGNVRFRAGGFSSRIAIPPTGSVFVRISQNGGKLERPSHLQISDSWSKDIVWKQVRLSDCLVETPYFLSPEQTFRTTLAFSAPDIQNGIALDFGDERDVLDVSVNGQRVARLWCPPYVCMISPMAVVGENEIEVVRTGTWRKRLQYDRSLPEERRKTWTP
jgi:hypothetical protein